MTQRRKHWRRPKVSSNKVIVSASVDEEIKLRLEMHGLDIPAIIRHTLSNIANLKKCPCCGREVRPVIVARKLDLPTDESPDTL